MFFLFETKKCTKYLQWSYSGTDAKKRHPILNHKDLRLSMSTVNFSIDFAATTSCPLNILKCMITHLYQTLTLLKKVTKINSVIKWHKLLGIQRPISIELTIYVVCESCSNHRRESETMMKRIETEKQRGETWLKHVNNCNLNNFCRFLHCSWLSQVEL